MKTENELNAEILKIIVEMKETFPELPKYIGEMPAQISDTVHNEINIDELQYYRDSLYAFLKSYSAKHEGTVLSH